MKGEGDDGPVAEVAAGVAAAAAVAAVAEMFADHTIDRADAV